MSLGASELSVVTPVERNTPSATPVVVASVLPVAEVLRCGGERSRQRRPGLRLRLTRFEAWRHGAHVSEVATAIR